MGQREVLRWRKDLTQWRQTNDRQDKYVVIFVSPSQFFPFNYYLLMHLDVFFYAFPFLSFFFSFFLLYF